MSEEFGERRGQSLAIFFSLSFGVQTSVSLSHICWTCRLGKNYSLDGRWNRWVSCCSHIYENVLKWLGLNLSRPRGGQFKTYAFCTPIWLCCLTVLLKKCHFFFPFFFFLLSQRCCTAAGLLLKSQRTFFWKIQRANKLRRCEDEGGWILVDTTYRQSYVALCGLYSF